MNEEPSPVEILLAEDNPGDVRLTEKAFEQASLGNNLYVVNDGVEAMQFLNSEPPFADTPQPDIVLLDLNMPRKNGQDVLAEMKSNDDLNRIPVVVLTSSESEEDVVKSYDLNANAYLTKPVDYDGFLDIVSSLENFWLQVVRLPPK
jgi:CheY-like chemotaxis protein